MDANKAFNTVMSRSGLSKVELSESLGKKRTYVSTMIYKNRVPKTDTFAWIANACGWDLLTRNRETGEEIVIDPPNDAT